MISLKQILLEQGVTMLPTPTLGGLGSNTSTTNKSSFAKKPSIKSKTNLDKFNDILKDGGLNYELDSPPDVDIKMSDEDTFLIKTTLGNRSNKYKLSLNGTGIKEKLLVKTIKLKSIQLEYSGTPEERKSDDYMWPGELYPKTKLVATFHVPNLFNLINQFEDAFGSMSEFIDNNRFHIIKISGNIVTVTIQDHFGLYRLLSKLLRGQASIDLNKILELIFRDLDNNAKIKGVLTKIS